jgi:DNA-binding MarR family transcriptional regulator
MKLEKLFENNTIQLEHLIFIHHKDLDLSSDEMMVIFGLLDILKKRNSFSLSALSKRISLVQKDISLMMDTLIKKNYLHTYLEDEMQPKAKELFHLDGFFSKLEQCIESQEVVKSKPNEEGLKKVIVLLEDKFKRLLTSQELQSLRQLMDSNHVTIQEVYDMIQQLNDRVSIKNIEKMIMISKNIPKVAIDEHVDRALDDLYKAMK